ISRVSWIRERNQASACRKPGRPSACCNGSLTKCWPHGGGSLAAGCVSPKRLRLSNKTWENRSSRRECCVHIAANADTAGQLVAFQDAAAAGRRLPGDPARQRAAGTSAGASFLSRDVPFLCGGVWPCRQRHI